MLTVEPGPHLLTDRLVMSPIVQGGDAAAAAIAQATGGSGTSGADVGFNPELDPELATVLRESMQEYERQAEAARAASATVPATAPVPAPVPATADMTPIAPVAQTADAPMDEDEELRRALEMSVLVDAQKAQQTPRPKPEETAATPMELTEDQQMEMALQMSMMQQGDAGAKPPAAATAPSAPPAQEKPAQKQNGPEANFGDLLGDQAFLSDLLSSLPGVNPADARIQDMVASIRGDKPKETDDQTKKEDKPKQEEPPK